MTAGAEVGLLLGAAFLVAAAYGVLAVIGGGLYLAYRKGVRREVDRLLRSVPGAAGSRPGAGRRRSERQGERKRP